MRIKKINYLFLLLFGFVFSVLGKDPFALPSKPLSQKMLFSIRYADAIQLAEYLQNKTNRFLSSDGQLIADKRTNKIWVEDDMAHLKKIKFFINAFDTPIQQVLIKAKIVMMDQHSMQQLGAFNEKMLLNLTQQKWFDLKLTALEQQGHINILAMPELVTNNRQSAMIESGEELPYQEKTGEGNTSTEFKKAVLRLKVMPIILPGKQILLKISVNQDKPSDLLIQGVPSISTQQLKTEVVIANQQTLILGGIQQEAHHDTIKGIPLLDQIPLFGYLFKNKQADDAHKRLVIFITPQIM